MQINYFHFKTYFKERIIAAYQLALYRVVRQKRKKI